MCGLLPFIYLQNILKYGREPYDAVTFSPSAYLVEPGIFLCVATMSSWNLKA